MGIFVVVFAVVLVLIRKRNRGRGREAKPLPVIQPYNSQPASFIAQLLTHSSAAMLDIKGRRRLLPPVEDTTPPGIIPPSKLATRRVSAVAAPPLDPAPVAIAEANVNNEEGNANDLPVRQARIRGIQEEDSGLRMVERLEEEDESIIEIMAPVYTAE